MFKRLMLVLALSVGVFALPSHAQESSNPYIYYFSDTLNAFIIERADGTDTHVLGDGLMALTGNTENIYVSGPGWSPSGKWFAWTATKISNSGYGWSAARPYVLSVDGTQRLTLLDNLDDASLAWAKDKDVLFVASQQSTQTNPDDPEDHHSIIDTYLAVIDVDSGRIMSTVEDHIAADYNFYWLESPTVIPTNDGKHFLVSYIDYEGGDSYYGTATIAVLEPNGAITKKRMDDYGPVNIGGIGPLTFPSVSSAGWAAFPTTNDFRIENALTDEQYIFAPLDNPQQVLWDTSGQYAMITDGNLWLLDCRAGTLTLLQENWESGDPYSYEGSIWSPDSSYAVLLGADKQLYVFNAKTSTLAELPVVIGNHYPLAEWYWPDDAHVVIHRNTEPGLIIYDLTSLTTRQIDVDLSLYAHPRLSSDERYVAFIDDSPVLYDTVSGIYHRFRPDYHSFNTAPGGEVSWNDTNDWLFVLDDALVAGGANVRYLDVLRADGAIRRDLSFSWSPNPITLNWLPPQVDPSNLPPALLNPLSPQPETVFYGSQWSFYVDWSPDGRWLATGMGWGSSGDITVWNVNTGEVVHVFKNAEEDEQVLWPQNEEFVPELTVPGYMPAWKEKHILAHSPDGSQVVQNNEYKTQVIDADTGKVVAHLAGEWDSYFDSASYSPDGHLLAATNPYMSVHIWDTTTWELVAMLPNPGQAVAFSPDGTHLAVTASWDVQIWNVAELLQAGVR